MLPLSPIEEPFPDLSNLPDCNILFRDLPPINGASGADVHNLADLPSPVSGPEYVAPMLSPSPPEDYPDIRNNIPGRTRDFSSQVAQNPLVHHLMGEVPQNLQVDELAKHGFFEESSLAGMELEHPESPLPDLLPIPDILDRPLVHHLMGEVPQNLQVDELAKHGFFEESSLAGMELEHPESPLPDLLPIPDILDRHASKEELGFERAVKRQKEAFGAKNLQGAEEEASAGMHISPTSHHPGANLRAEHIRGAFKSGPADVADVPSSDIHEYLQFQDGPGDLLANMSPLSRFIHASPSNSADERPTKRQRTSQEVAASNSTPAVSQLFSGPSSQVDQVLIQGRIANSSANLLASMPVLDDVAIQRNLMGIDVGYQWTSNSGASAIENASTDAENEIAVHQGKETASERITQPAQYPAELHKLPENEAPLQTQRNLVTNLNKGIIFPSYATESRKMIQNPLNVTLVESDLAAGPMPVSSASPSLHQSSKPDETFEAEASLPEQPEVIAHSSHIDYPAPSEGPPHSGNIASVSNAPSLSENLGLELHEVPGNKTNEDDLQSAGEPVIQAPEEHLNDLGHTIIGSEGFFTIVKLKNPPECNVCGKVYIKVEDLKKHTDTSHRETKDKDYECTICKSKFMSPTNLRRHRDTAHQNQTFLCSVCDVGFSTKRAQVIHERKQHGVVPASVRRRRSASKPSSGTDVEKVLIYFDCQLCEYLTHVKGNLKRHNNGKHRNERPYPCPHCDKRAKTKQNLQFHIPVCERRLQAASKKAKG